ncbi:hypothetical protein GCM10023085_24280 [Actinomadura viridis]|uniref:Vanadium-dependent haloperoxidase n=1 Tax=Actinomadura viridis TaxID=58110 RepID=A0A931GJ53_9ACTN|nr:vanadium-dependent haloperoxidase [Actinomadura viridis]MBG6088802.1 hypothetical protein [Actinomadura viridis]
MTTPEQSDVPSPSLGRRSLLIGGLGGASTVALTALGHTGTAAAAPRPSATNAPTQIDFDFDEDNFHRDLIAVAGDSTFGGEQAFGPMDASIIIWIQGIMVTAWFDALAPYHPTAVGLHSRIARRPRSEAATNRNKNIAAIHATYQVVKTVYPERSKVVAQVMTAIGMNPEDDSEDPATPVGIGNIAGKASVKAHLRDGMNFLGDEGRKYHGQEFEDYTGYQPVNTAYKLVDPSRWQPRLHTHRRRVGGGPGDKGIFVSQHFVTPHAGLVKAHTYRDPGRFKLAPPDHLDHTDRQRYKRSADEILAASAALTDRQKVTVEFFDNKFLGIGQATLAAGNAHDLDLDAWVHLQFTSGLAQFDDLIAAWHYKRKYEAPRPFTVIRHVYGDRRVTAWGGVGKGTVNDIPADEWSAYIPVGDHPEYPSGSTTLCAAEAQASRRFLGDDILDWRYSVKAGATLTEPRLVPAKDVELHYPTWTAFNQDCARSRVWGGVHFPTTVERSLEFGKQFGDLAYEFAQRYIKGEVGD